NGIPTNCSASEANPQTVTVPAGSTGQATFTVTCTALTGSLTVNTTTTGPNQPSGYTVTVDGGQSRSLGLNTSTTYTGLTATNHTVQLNGIPTNCSVDQKSTQPNTSHAASTDHASFTK